MTLTETDAKYFYSLWIPLLDFVNHKYKLKPALYGMDSPMGLPLPAVSAISEKLWSDPSIIAEYISENKSLLDTTAQSILNAWMTENIHDRFIIDRHLHKGSILISLTSEEVYLVKGIYSSIKEMFEGVPIPQVVNATLLPFKNMIIYDGVMIPYGVTLGRNIADQAKNIYMDAKSNNKIHATF